MELQPEALPFHEPDRCPPSPASFHQPFCDCPATLVMTMAPSRPTCLYYDHRMPDPVPCGEQDVLDDLLDSAQRLAIEVINYPSDERDEAMQRIGGLLTDVACEAGCTHEIATEFRAAMEQAIRDYVAEIEASGGGTVGPPAERLLHRSAERLLTITGTAIHIVPLPGVTESPTE
jgi:hypothetical protein